MPHTAQHLATISRTNWPKLKRFFRAKVAEPDCYDLTQDTLLAFVRTDPQRIARPEAYLWTIARNKLIDYYKRKRPTEVFESSRVSIAEVFGDARGISTQLDQSRRLTAALQRLPVDEQIVFELRFGEELGLAEVAEAVGVSLATVKRMINRARASLQATLNEAEFKSMRADEAAVVHAYRRE